MIFSEHSVSKLCKCTKSLEQSCSLRQLEFFQVNPEGISRSSWKTTFTTQLNLPISIFFFIALWPWYTNESMIPETVNTPAHQEDFVQS